ncbi:hypothetical protein HFP89_08100 [Wenzhouxiangella sp. XN79A]|uniref:hypothetical protein n=1 Tax=Wenzhouxiangella sp. XN79A TaxID=2724193 RepID=UPI00144A6D46|nr:hypothetical protein [Wenzhouxiangella sp. XN79A]NKI35126.1 hypothetical protein [Wenzhouxiangella sp. XN79A]
MTLITAWLEIDTNRLSDCIVAMVFSVDPSCRSWSRLVLDDTASPGDAPPLAHSSESTAIVRFQLPGDMECALGDTLRQVDSVGNAVGSAKPEPSSNRPLVTVAVPCLPAAFANEIHFCNERSEKEFQSTLRRLLPGRGEWIRTRSSSDAGNDVPGPGPGSTSLPPGTRDRAAEKHERLAAAAATTALLARTEIGDARTVTFDIGSVALLRQLVSGDPSVPKRKLLEADAKELLKQLLAAARKQDLKPGTAPRVLPPETSFGLQVAGALEAELRAVDQPDGAQAALLPADSNNSRSEPESVDQALFTHIFKSLVDSAEFPSTARLLETIRSAEQSLAATTLDHPEAQGQATEALSVILENIETAEQRVDHFAEHFHDFPALVGVAYAFWGWSSNPLQNFEQRVQLLKEKSPGAHQAALALFAAAAGSSRLRPAYLRSRLWMAVYRSTWTLLLSHRNEGDSKRAGKARWNVTHGNLDLKETGPVVEVRLGEFEIPLGLQIIDHRLVVKKKAEVLLRGPHAAAKAADAILAAVDGVLSAFTLDLKKLVRRDLTIELGRNVVGRISGSAITFENVGEKELTTVLRWEDAERAAELLSRGKALDRILEGLPDSVLENLASELNDLAPKTTN